MDESRQRRKRNQRDAHPPAMVLTERDKDILEMVYRCRVLRQNHLHSLFFGTSKAASQRRLFLLYQHGYLARHFLTARASYLLSQALYVLDKRGGDVLRAERGYESIKFHANTKELSQQFLEHTLAINDVRVAITIACKQQGYTLPVWKTDFDLKADFDRVTIQTRSGRFETMSLIPDSYFIIQTSNARAPFFLELDRGTMELSRFQTKILAYQAYVISGAYQARYNSKSLRVLTVTISKKRRDQLRKIAEEAGGRERYWFSTLSDIDHASVLINPIWIQCATQHPSPLFR